MSEEQTLTDKQELFLEAVMGEARGNLRAAMRIAGYSDTPKAAFGMIDVLDDPNTLGARNSISAAREILDRTGLVKKEKIEVTGATGGIFILPPKQEHGEDDTE